MNDYELKSRVIDLISQLPAYSHNSSGTQHTVRCPYCGDSVKNLNHGHFGIIIDVNNPSIPMLYNCLRCPVSGYLTASVLEELGVYDTSDIAAALTKSKMTTKYNKFTNTKTENYIVPLYESNLSNNRKLEYINDRLGTNIDYNMAKDLKIVFDLSVFSVINEIGVIKGVTPNVLKLIDDAYIGFLSANNNVLTYRLTKDIPYMRYNKIKINEKNLDPNSFYSIPNSIDLMYNHDINIHIAEGTFDTISIFLNLNHGNLENNYYYANCGFGYATIIDSIISQGVNTGLNLHIYADNDKKDREILSKIYTARNKPWIKSLTIHRNGSGVKDYGVSPDLINDTKKRYF